MAVHVWEAIDAIVDLTNEAYKVMGGTSKDSISDQMELAAIERIEDFVVQFGEIPGKNASKSEREAYVKKIADFTMAQLRKEFSSKH